MLPFNPSTPYIRTSAFVHEEWLTYFSSSSPYPAYNISGGWRGILYANLASIDPKASWEFFARDDFDPAWLDGGASRTWALICAAGKFYIISTIFVLSLGLQVKSLQENRELTVFDFYT